MHSPKGTNFFKEVISLIDEKSISGQILHLLLRQLDTSCIPQDPQTVYSRHGIVKLLILFKLLSIPSIHSGITIQLHRLIPIGKDVFYKLRNCSFTPWRRLLYHQAMQCMDKVQAPHGDVYKPWTLPCFIVDDTDLPKRGKCMERIGRIYSHLTGKFLLGYKCLNLALWNGSSLFHLDFSLHIEMGQKKNQGLKQRELKKRFRKSRKKGCPGKTREREAFNKKTDQLVKMLQRAVNKGFSAQYVLADSWFFCEKLVLCVLDLGMHLISRPRFNNWVYDFEGKNYTLGKLIRKLRRSKDKKWNKQLKMHHLTVTVLFKGHPVRIFFYKEKRRKSKWEALISTDKGIGAVQAYKTYKNRWSIEVAYKELKQHLGFGKCQARDFDAHIADTTLALMAYNFLSCIKTVNDYQTIGQLFEKISANWVKPTIMERFWKQFYLAIQTIAELVQKSTNELIELVIEDTDFFFKWKKSTEFLGAET